jgi:hypothetical protein
MTLSSLPPRNLRWPAWPAATSTSFEARRHIHDLSLSGEAELKIKTADGDGISISTRAVRCLRKELTSTALSFLNFNPQFPVLIPSYETIEPPSNHC